MSSRRWCVMDLVTDPLTGKLKETLLWSNLGKLSALVWFSFKCYKGTDYSELWWCVMVVLTAHAAFSQLVMSRMGKTETTSTSSNSTTTTTP